MAYLGHIDRVLIQKLISNTDEDSLQALLDKARTEHPSKPGMPDMSYPYYAGSLQYFVSELRRMVQLLDQQLEEVRRHDTAMQWAAEYTLTDSVLPRDGLTRGSSCRSFPPRWEKYYEAVAIIQQAMKDGMSDERLREYLKDGITDQEYAQERFLDPDEVCTDCEEYIGKNGVCIQCQC